MTTNRLGASGAALALTVVLASLPALAQSPNTFTVYASGLTDHEVCDSVPTAICTWPKPEREAQPAQEPPVPRWCPQWAPIPETKPPGSQRS